MKWYSTKRKIFPTHKQEVFICVDGIIYEAVFNETEKCFNVKDQISLSFKAENKTIFWQSKTSE